MRVHQWVSRRVGRGIAVALVLAFSGALLAVAESRSAPSGTKGKLDATIFSYDGQDFVRARSTVLTKDGKSVVSTGTREEMERDVQAMHEYGLWATMDKSE